LDFKPIILGVDLSLKPIAYIKEECFIEKLEDTHTNFITFPIKSPLKFGAIRKSTRHWTIEEDENLKKFAKLKVYKNWEEISEYLKDRTAIQCYNRWNKVLNPDLTKIPWTIEEDEILSNLIHISGTDNWTLISKNLPGRIGKQCRERWNHHLNPEINNSPFTQIEENILLDEQDRIGNKWSKIALLLPGRTENQIKNTFHSLIYHEKKGSSKRKRNDNLSLIENEKSIAIENFDQEFYNDLDYSLVETMNEINLNDEIFKDNIFDN